MFQVFNLVLNLPYFIYSIDRLLSLLNQLLCLSYDSSLIAGPLQNISLAIHISLDQKPIMSLAQVASIVLMRISPPRSPVVKHPLLLSQHNLAEMVVLGPLHIRHSSAELSHHYGYKQIHHYKCYQEGGHQEETKIIFVKVVHVEGTIHGHILLRQNWHKKLFQLTVESVFIMIDRAIFIRTNISVLSTSKPEENSYEHDGER